MELKFSKDMKVLIIAELSANHNGDLQTAIETVRAAKRAGADVIKLQTYRPDTITLDSDKDDFQIKGTIWDGQNLFELYGQAYTPWEWHEELYRVAKEEGLICFSSPFDKTAVDFLEDLDFPAYKIASFEITDIPLIEYVASKGKPIIISTGIAKLEDIELAIETCKNAGNEDIILLKCTSSYPAPVEDANMVMIKELADRFNVITGLSDHTLGITVPIVATALGAKVIEKHFILNKEVGGPDAAFSLDEKEFAKMVVAVREAEEAIGAISFELTQKMKEGRKYCRSLYVSDDIKVGDILNKNNVRSVRPGYGLHPKYYKEILGKKAVKNVKKGTRFSLDIVE